jgi:hypothetical protein
VKKINGAHDADRLKCFESQQIEVVRDDEVRIACESASKNVVVGRIFFDNVWDDSRDNNCSGFVYDSHMEAYFLLIPMKVSPRNASKLPHNKRRDNEFVMVMNGMGPHLEDCAFRASKNGNIDVSIQNLESEKFSG